MNEEADKWYYDLGKLAEKVETNRKNSLVAQHRADVNRKRQWALTLFTLVAFLTVSYRTEIITHRQKISTSRVESNTQAIAKVQGSTCLAENEVLKTFNREHQLLAEIERTNLAISPTIREARVRAYEQAIILVLPVCGKN